MRLLGPELNTIWKFVIPIEDEFYLEMPSGSVPLSVGWQESADTSKANGEAVLWAAVDRDAAETERHRFFLRGTGHPFPGLLFHRFVGTFTVAPFGLVFHLFDAGPETKEA